MVRHNIEWQGVKYPAIDLVIFEGTNEEMNVTVSSTTLEQELMRCMQNCIGSDEALWLDEKIAYYLEPDEMKLPDEEIVRIVEESYS